MTSTTDKVFWSANEIAALLGVTADCVRQWSRERTADFPRPAVAVRGAMRWRRVTVEGWVESMERGGR